MKNQLSNSSKYFFLVIIFFFNSIIYGQFTSKDTNLVRTIYHRTFDKDLISGYLSAGDKEKVTAGLLCLANSDDTSFVKDVIKLDYSKFGDQIAFTLGKLGPSKLSETYLLEKAASNKSRVIYNSLGKIVDSLKLSEILSEKLSDKNKLPNGISLLLVNSYLRGIKTDSSLVNKCLLSELNSGDDQRLFDALYALYRMEPPAIFKDPLTEILATKKSSETYPIVEYTLGCLRKMSAVPADQKLFDKLIKNPDWKIRTEFIRTYVKYNFTTETNLFKFADLILDKNPNAAVQAAISVRQLKVDKSLKDTLLVYLNELIPDSDLSNNVRGEVFISIINLLDENPENFFEQYKDDILFRHQFEALTDNKFSTDFVFEYLQNEIPDLEESDLHFAAQTLMTLQDSLRNKANYQMAVNTFLNSNYPHVMAVTALGLDTNYIAANSAILQQIVFEQVLRNLNDANFSEALFMLGALSKNIGEDFAQQIFAMMKTSELNSVRKFANEQISGHAEITSRNDSLFDAIWEFAFAFKKVQVNTNRGSFTIKLNNGYAPITVGNFLKLASEGYFDNLIFHRVVPNFVIQTGDPTGTGWSGPGFEIISEFSSLPFKRNAVGMASAGKDTEGSQWFVMHNFYPHLDGNYTNFGEVISGIETVDLIQQGDFITDIELIK